MNIPDFPVGLETFLSAHSGAVSQILHLTIGMLNDRLAPVTVTELTGHETSSEPFATGDALQDASLSPLQGHGTEALRQSILLATRHLGIERVRFLTLGELTCPGSTFRTGPDGTRLSFGCGPGGRTFWRWHVERKIRIEERLTRAEAESGTKVIVPLTRWCDATVNRLTLPFRHRPTVMNGLSVFEGAVHEALMGAFRVGFAYPTVLALLGGAHDARTLSQCSATLPDGIPLFVDPSGTELTVLVRS